MSRFRYLSTWLEAPVTLPLDAALYQAELDRRLEHSKLRQKANIDANVDMSQSYR